LDKIVGLVQCWFGFGESDNFGGTDRMGNFIAGVTGQKIV
jgi:hypothetical protein